ncbi:MAG: ABC transporter permease [Burkholderiaceae bacterium]
MSIVIDRSLSPLAMLRSVERNRRLILRLARREVIGRYRGSLLGLAWSFFYPLLMLVVYTYMFTVVFQARWPGDAAASRSGFAVAVFAGMIVHGLFAECINRAPGLVLNNANYVKKTLFPLEILPWVALGSALFHCAASLIVLLVAQWLLNGSLPGTVWLFPLVVLPLAIGSLGAAWFLASLGVYARDVGQVAAILTMVLMFLSPVFYPLSAVPESFRFWMQLNPLTSIIEQSRLVLIDGAMPDWTAWATMLGLSVVVAWLGFCWFQYTRKGFADVL